MQEVETLIASMMGRVLNSITARKKDDPGFDTETWLNETFNMCPSDLPPDERLIAQRWQRRYPFRCALDGFVNLHR